RRDAHAGRRRAPRAAHPAAGRRPALRSYEASDEQAIATAQRFVKEAGCDAVKLEGGGQSVSRSHAIASAGIPVMGHVGLTPQTATALGGYKAQGRTAERALDVARDAAALELAGCFSIVFEA